MTITVKAADAAQFLSLVPQLVGFLPRRSVVLVPFARGRSVGALRFDLPDNDDDADRLAATFVGTVCRIDGVDAFAVVVYTDELIGQADPPHGAIAAALALRAEECGLRMHDALCVGADAWSRYHDADGDRAAGSLADIAVAMLPTGIPTLDAGAELPKVDLAEKERVGRAFEAVTRALESLVGDGRAAASGDDRSERRVDPAAVIAISGLDDLPALFEEALEWDAAALAPFDAALMLWCLNRPSLRDVALVQWTGDQRAGDEAMDAQRRWEEGEPYPPELALRMWGEGAIPDRERLATALELCRQLAARAPREQRPGALAMCGWLSWALGRSTHAALFVERALDIDAEHGLAEIVLSFTQAGHLPDWAFRAASTRSRTRVRS